MDRFVHLGIHFIVVGSAVTTAFSAGGCYCFGKFWFLFLTNPFLYIHHLPYPAEFVEKCVPEIIPYVSTCKSPHMMSGAIIKNWFAEKLNVPAQDVCVVSIMPCVRKQGEADRIWYHTPSGARDVDHVLTTRDLGQLLRDKGIDFGALSDDTRYDNFLGIGTGAAALFGTTGGVMEAALRTVYELVSGRPMEPPKYEPLRGVEGLKEATVVIPANAQGPLHNAEVIFFCWKPL